MIYYHDTVVANSPTSTVLHDANNPYLIFLYIYYWQVLYAFYQIVT